jgi:hypothetical protein
LRPPLEKNLSGSQRRYFIGLGCGEAGKKKGSWVPP